MHYICEKPILLDKRTDTVNNHIQIKPYVLNKRQNNLTDCVEIYFLPIFKLLAVLINATYLQKSMGYDD